MTLRVRRDVPGLRARRRFRSIRAALTAGKARFGFRLVHYSVQGNHFHLLAEARDTRSLARGMQGLAVRLARAINRATPGRSGSVFADRYHAHALTTPREVRNALRYVLNDARRHQPRTGPPSGMPLGFVDGCSSAAYFDGWRAPPHPLLALPDVAPEGPDLPVAAARTWLLRKGWRRYGLLQIDEVPTPKPNATSQRTMRRASKPNATSQRTMRRASKPSPTSQRTMRRASK